MRRFVNILILVPAYLIFGIGLVVFIGMMVGLSIELYSLREAILTSILIASPVLLYMLYGAYKKQRSLVQTELQRRKQYREWIENVEPKLRDSKGYPDDWSERRHEVYIRAGGICASCGTKVVRHGHTHHKRPISDGGNHAFSNLELLCENCHIEKHPNVKMLRMNQRLRTIYIGRNADIKRARRSWKCALCESEIARGESYYGGSWHKLCLSCYNPTKKYR